MQRKTSADVLPLRFIHSARKNWSRFAMADSTGREQTYGRALAGSLLLSSWMKRNCAAEEMIGVLLPASTAGAVTNVAISAGGKVSVNLNFSAGPEAITAAVRQCGIRTIVTSKTFLAKAHIEAADGMVFVEDILATADPAARMILRMRHPLHVVLRHSR